MHRRTIGVLVASGALALPAAAQAHVTLQPNTAQAGAYTVLDVRVPNERDKASTVKVDVQFPDGFAAVSYQPMSGWKVKVVKKKLATPIQTDDGPITEGISRMIWTGSRKGLGKVAPGQFMDFPISVKIPGKAGDVLTFKALQTYSNGEVVRWIGPPNADEPAPRVTVTAAKAQGASHSSGAVAVAGGGRDGDGPSPLGLIAAAAAVALVGVALLRRRMSHPMRGAQR
ncbi:MAG TPA: YcnI family protein [Polyangia bacterium]